MRVKKYVISKYKSIGYFSGLVIIIESFILLLPLIALPFFPYESEVIRLFLKPFFFSLTTGILITCVFRKHEKVTLSNVDYGVMILFIWGYASFIGAFPFLLTGDYTFIHGLFESVSGWTTTGLSVVDVTAVPNLLLLWRSIMQFIGGAGFAVIMIGILSGPYISGIYKAEGHSGEIGPHIKITTKIVLKIYMVYLVSGTIAYIIAGMNLFDAVNHCMAAIGTGGFSTKPNSINSFDSFPIELVSIVLMFTGQTNFAIHHQIFKGKWLEILKNGEVRTTFFTLLFVIPLVLFFTTIPLYAGNADGFFNIINFSEWWLKFEIPVRRAVFEPVSALTTTGFNSAPSFIPWSNFGILVIIIMMWTGGHTNSTAGGLKQHRLYMLLKSLYSFFKEQFLPSSSVNSHYIHAQERKIFLKPEHFIEVFNYLGIYILTFLTGSIIIILHGYPIKESFFEFASALSTVGLSVGIISFDAPAGVLITTIFGMFLGRLEFFVIFIAVIKVFKDLKVYLSKDII
jgi:trk system potassium uptake protein